ncbi:cytochrome P450 [Streptomyces silvensis]|uniref:Cytochrome n=1 Tax=Streptomyces silvensis TaxID=1765722 RepID=A0A0W7WWW4_9ACTN|nr:cytochrome P450 [Streptomyces silvensis]KUF15072.1 cytochrome [Streptomyces silvensis]
MGDKRRFRRDPLAYIEGLRRRSTTGIIRLPWGEYCVSDANQARALLRDPEFHTGMSDFFGALLPTREAQVAVGHAVRDFLRAGVPQYRAGLARAVTELDPAGRWPESGNRLVHRSVADLMLHPGTPAATRRLSDRAARGGVVFHAPQVWRRVRAEILRARLVAALTEQVRQRREHPAEQPRDVLDAVLGACPAAEVPDRAVAELQLMMHRAIVVPLSASLAWSVLLGCLHHTADSPWPWPVDQVVREALRHRPMPWVLARTVPRPLEVGGVPFRAGDLLSVSPYLTHHDEQQWSDPDVFRPERWQETGDHGCFITFGAGPFTCAGAAVAQTLLVESLTALTHDAHLSVTGGNTRAAMAEGNVPRPFTLRRTPMPPPKT